MKKTGLKIGITGGIGSGKSLLSDFISKKGYTVIDADSLGKQVLQNDPAVRAKIIEAFGNESYKGSEPDSKFIASVVFSDAEKLKQINSIIHPPVMKKVTTLMNDGLKSKNLVFVESAIIFESKLEDYFDYTILLVADEEVRIKRLLNKQHLDREQIVKRMENQLPDKDKKESADFTLVNNSTDKDLFVKAEFLLNLLKSMALK